VSEEKMKAFRKFMDNSERGAAVVEFALVVPLLLLFLFGIIEFSVILYDNAVITNASREVAREWVEYTPNKLESTDLEAIATNYVKNRLISFGQTSTVPQLTFKIDNGDGAGFQVKTEAGTTSYNSASLLSVNIQYTYDYLLLPAMVEGILPTLNLTAETVMRAE
jgi:Flp pilus assembly protein TadG